MSGRIVEDVAAVYQGRIRTVAATEPILRGPHGPATADELVDARDDALLVLRVQVLRPPSPGRFDLLGRKSEHLRDVLVHQSPSVWRSQSHTTSLVARPRRRNRSSLRRRVSSVRIRSDTSKA